MKNELDKLIKDTIEQINIDLNVDLLKNGNTDIIGGTSPLDSLGVISFLLELENQIETKYNLSVTLVNETVLMEENSPIKNFNLLKNHLENVLT